MEALFAAIFGFGVLCMLLLWLEVAGWRGLFALLGVLYVAITLAIR